MMENVLELTILSIILVPATFLCSFGLYLLELPLNFATGSFITHKKLFIKKLWILFLAYKSLTKSEIKFFSIFLSIVGMRNGQVQKFAAALHQNVCWNTEHRLMHRFRLFVKKNYEQEQNRLHSITCKRECGKVFGWNFHF